MVNIGGLVGWGMLRRYLFAMLGPSATFGDVRCRGKPKCDGGHQPAHLDLFNRIMKPYMIDPDILHTVL